jgi:hypothetical protein
MEDNYFREYTGARPIDTFDLIRLARTLETSPGLLMDLLECRCELPFELADKIAQELDVDSDWILSGSSSPFPIVRIGNRNWYDFFLPELSDASYSFELIRVAGGRHEGTLFCLRTSLLSGSIKLGVVTEAFVLAPGMGGGGHGNLSAFLIFLKTRCANVALSSFEWDPESDNFDFWNIFGQHLPFYFQNSASRRSVGWLQQLFSGEDPRSWYKGWSGDLKKIADTPFGNAEPSCDLLQGTQ